MLSVEECRKILGDLELTDEQVEQLRDVLTELASCVIDGLFEKNGN